MHPYLKNGWRTITITLLAAFLVPHAVAQTQDVGKVVRIETARPDSVIPLFTQATEGANATVLLLPGGKGGIGPIGKGGRPSSTNFLIRSGEHFLAAGFNVAMMSKPLDLQELDGPFRVSAEHADDIRKTVSYLKQRFGVPVWIVGTSWGSTSTAAAAIALRDEGLIAGIVLTSSLTSYRVKESLPKLDMEKINVPTLVMHHEKDDCKHCQPHEIEAIFKKLKNAPVKKLMMVSGGGNPTGDPCYEFHYHGYIGMESQAVSDISAWIKRPTS